MWLIINTFVEITINHEKLTLQKKVISKSTTDSAIMNFASHNARNESREMFSGYSMKNQALTWILFLRGRCMGSGSASISFRLRLLTCGKENTNDTGNEWVMGKLYLSAAWFAREIQVRLWLTLGTEGNMHFVHRVKFKSNLICFLKAERHRTQDTLGIFRFSEYNRTKVCLQ
jgi:hypothetical protein